MLKIEQGCYVWKAGDDCNVSPFFNTKEFACHCGCVMQKIAVVLVHRLTQARIDLGAPIKITSGYRCHARQAALKAQGYETAAGVSQHELGNAADLQTSNMADLLISVKNSGFKAIGLSSRFIHVDIRDDKERRWSYAK